MLGRHSPQGELFRPDSLYLEHVGRDSFYGFLATTRHQLFRDSDFAGLYRKDLGRPSVPPSQLCIALLLQAREGVSDEEAIQCTAFDLRWKVALGLEVDEKLCAKSTLQLFRAKLIVHEKFQDVFQKSIQACQKAGLMRRKKLEIALDSTPVFGRGAVKDTFNLISDQVRTVVRAVVALKGYDLGDLVAEQGLGRHFGSSLKSHFEIDWGDPDQKRAVVGQLVADARVTLELAKDALRGYAKGADHTRELREAGDLLADLLLQDIDEEPEDGGGPRIHQGTKKDRIISTTDPEMRHGRKSPTKTFDGYKASVAVDTEDGVVLSTDVCAANAHDSESAGRLVKQSGDAAGREVERVLGDTAYGTSNARREISNAAKRAEVIAKAPAATSRKGTEFTVEDFKIDIESGVATCPAGKKSIRHERPKGTTNHRFMFSRNDCTSCPMRSKCTTSRVGARGVTVIDGYDELQRHRRRQRTKSFKQIYRRRVKVEHRIARLVQLGVRQARYLGRQKVAFQVCIAATVANLILAATKGLRRFLQRPKTAREVSSALRLMCVAGRTFLAMIVAAQVLVARIIGDQRLAHELAPSRPGL